jgi:glycosyltransferase involved in cell wall biosynthesis
MVDITGIVPTLNNERTILRCLKSLRANSVEDVVLVDGGSVDRTLDLASQFSEVRQVRSAQGSCTIPEAREIGWRSARSEFVLFLDADAFIPKENATTSLLPFVSARDVAGVTCRIECANSERLLPRLRDVDFRVTYPEDFERIQVISCICDPFVCGLFRRDAIEAVGGFDPSFKFGEDLWVLAKLRTAKYRVLTVYEPSVKHYHREDISRLGLQFYHHGTGRRILAYHTDANLYVHKEPWRFIRRMIHSVRAGDLPAYLGYRIFTEMAFLVGYLHG